MIVQLCFHNHGKCETCVILHTEDRFHILSDFRDCDIEIAVAISINAHDKVCHFH